MASQSDRTGEEPGSEHAIVCRSPATLARIDEVPEATPADVEAAVADAAAAQPAWADRSIADRRDVLARVRDLLLDRRESLAETVSTENGKPPGEAVATDVGPALNAANFLVERGPDVVEESIPLGRFESVGESTVLREPVGVVGVITPWNYPFGIPASEVLPALFAGNAVVLKPAVETTLTALAFRDLLHDAGVPEDVLAVVPGRGPTTGQALAEAELDHLSFTGSADVGFMLRETCEPRGVSTSLELGGSDPAVVLEDADVDLTAAGITWARFANAGQSCAAPKRCFALEGVADELTDALVERAAALEIGGDEGSGAGDLDDAEYEMGPLISAEAVETIHDQVTRSVEQGAEVLTGGEPLDREGHYYPPTILADVTPDMPVMTEETFGPVLPIASVPDVETAIERANDTNYGLSGSVWTTDEDRGAALAREIDAGTVTVNDHLYTFTLHATPWGGPKDSGGDFSHGRWGIESVTDAKHVHVAPGTASLSSGRFEDPWWFPYDDDFEEAIGDTLELLYGSSVVRKLRHTPGAIRAILSE
jgi:succinate-semialdehyde dehydrogenase/glutarate-semialdehyde dehydrogenase